MATIKINTIQDLIAFSNGDYGRGTSSEYLDVVLTADLDFADLTEYDSPYNWGGCTGTWYVNFDGQGHKVDNIYYAGAAHWGFFYETNGGSIKNLRLTNIYITTTTSCGIIVNRSGGTNFENIHISGDITANGYCACFSAYNGTNTGRITITNCSFAGSIRSMTSFCSLIVSEGYNRSAVVNNFAANGNISSSENLYLWGSNADGMISNAYFIGVANTRSSLRLGLYGGPQHNVYFVLKSGSKTSASSYNSVFNCYYDSTVATAAGISVSGVTPATTAELQDAQWLRDHDFTI